MRSGLERQIDIQLKRSKVAYSYETLKLPYITQHVYCPDFILGNGIILEVKGVLNKYDTRETAKMIAVKKQHPELDIRFVFADAHRKIPRMKSTHAMWATKNGFPWADGEIPKEWLSE